MNRCLKKAFFAVSGPAMCIASSPLFFAFLTVGPVQSATWLVDGAVTETLSANDNIEQVPESPGFAYGSNTSANFALRGTTPTSELTISANVNATVFTGPGADTDDLNSINPVYSGGYQKSFQDYDLRLSGVFRSQNTTFSELNDTGILTEGSNTQTDISASGGITYRISPNLRTTLDVSFDDTSFSEASDLFNPSTSFLVANGWSFDFNSRLQFNFRTSYRDFSSTTSESVTYSGRGGFRYLLSEKLAADAAFGLSAVDTEVLSPAPIDAGISVTNLFDVGLTYQTQNSTASIFLTQSTDPSLLGELQTNRVISGSLGHRINQRNTIGLAARFGTRSATAEDVFGTADDRTFFSVSPSYSASITDNLRANLRYQFLFQDVEAGTSVSNGVFFSLSNAFDPLLLN